MHETLPLPLRQFVAKRADEMGLQEPDDYILLLIRLAKQDHDLNFLPVPCLKQFAT